MAILSYAIERYQAEKSMSDAKLMQKLNEVDSYLDNLLK